mgnify:CR=1 FL=1
MTCLCLVSFIYNQNIVFLLLAQFIKIVIAEFGHLKGINEKLFLKYLSFPMNVQLSRKEIEELYGTRHIGRDQARGLDGLMDFFCFSEVGFIIIYIFSLLCTLAVGVVVVFHVFSMDTDMTH